MRIGAILMHLDETDLLRRNISYHSSIGVDYFVICDRGSSVEAQQELDELSSSENIHHFRQPLYDAENITSETMRCARLAAVEEMRRVFAPDWLFPADADEFWVPADGSLASVINAADSEHFKVSRFNAALVLGAVQTPFQRMREANALLQQDIIVQREQLTPERMAANGIPWVFKAIGPKFMTSRTDFVEVMPGFHDLKYSGNAHRYVPPDLLILHLPFTTLERFSAKVAKIRRHLEHLGHTFRSNQARQWRWWSSIDDEDALQEEFGKQFFSANNLEELRTRGAVMAIEDYFATQLGDK